MPEKRLQKTRDAYREPKYERTTVHDDTFDPREVFGRGPKRAFVAKDKFTGKRWIFDNQGVREIE